MKFFVCCICIIALPYILKAQSNDETAIRSLMNNQAEAWNAGDINGFMQGYWQNDSLVCIGKNGPAYGWKTTLANYKKHYPDTIAMGNLQLNILQMEKLSEAYYFVIGKWFLTREKNNIGGAFTLLFRKINGNWLIVVDHTD